jgi:hypothetical protein
VAKKSKSKQIKDMLSRGQLSIPDQVTGFHHSLYACCPKDGNDSLIYRTERSGVAITRVVFRCPICSVNFDASVDSMFLR